MNKFDVGPTDKNKGVNASTEMYMNQDTAKVFAGREKEDPNHGKISKIIEKTVLDLFTNKNIKIANLGAGANPQKYKALLEKIQSGSKMDWVDISPKMLELASKEVDSSQEIRFIKNDFIGYLNSQDDKTLDCVIMQYAINYIENLESFFDLLSKKLNTSGAYIANLGTKVLKNNQEASFLVNGQEFTGQKSLVSGDRYTIQFLNEDGTIFASTEKTFFSDEEILSKTAQYGLTAKIENIDGFEVVIVKKP